MASTPQRPSNLNIQPIVDQILLGGQLSRQEYLQLTTAILSDYNEKLPTKNVAKLIPYLTRFRLVV